MADKEEKIYGLGSVWAAVNINDDKAIISLLPRALNSNQCDIYQSSAIFTGLSSFNGPIKTMTILKTEKNKNFVYSFYPFITDVIPVEIELIEIEEWGNGAEAEIRGNIENGPVVSFFDALYFKNKESYKIGKKYTFNLAAIAYYFAKRTEYLEIQAEEGITAGEVFDTSKMTIYFPNEVNTEDFTFYFPFAKWSEKNIEFNRQKFYKYDFVMDHANGDPMLSFPLFVNCQLLGDYKPRKGDPIQGTGWLMGYLVDSEPTKLT